MYDQFYNLKTRPFRLSPDPRFLFRSKAHGKALAYLSYGLKSGEGFVVITGGVGTGKTTLARLILSTINRAKVMAVQMVSSQLETDDVLRLVAAELGLAHQDLPKSTLLKNIERFLMARAREGKRVLLLVDEAQNLSRTAMEELRMLSNFQVGERVLLQSFLLGQEEFRPKVQAAGMEQFRQRIIASYHLGPLNREEVQEYILHRLRLSGWQADPVITDVAFDRIYEYSSGVPRRINKLCDRLLLHGSIEELHEINAADVNHVAEEEKQEIQSVEDNIGRMSAVDGTPEDRSVIDRTVQSLDTDSTPSANECRLRALEKRVELLENTIQGNPGCLQQLKMMPDLADDRDMEQADIPGELGDAVLR